MPLSGVELGDRHPFAEHLASWGEWAADSLGDQLVDPISGQLDDQTGAFEVDEGKELASNTNAATTHDRAFLHSWVLELKGADEIP